MSQWRDYSGIGEFYLIDGTREEVCVRIVPELVAIGIAHNCRIKVIPLPPEAVEFTIYMERDGPTPNLPIVVGMVEPRLAEALLCFDLAAVEAMLADIVPMLQRADCAGSG